MLDAVLVFTIINVMFELVVLSMVPPRARLRILGSKRLQTGIHISIMIFMLIVHWGTVIGTMAGFGSFVMSIATVSIARQLWGYVEGTRYRRGIIGYTREELRS